MSKLSPYDALVDKYHVYKYTAATEDSFYYMQTF